MNMSASEFEAQRPRLTAIANRILESSAEADDLVQESWLRLNRTETVENPRAWLTTVLTRLCLDQLRKRRTRSAAETHLAAAPEPVDLEADTLLAEQVGEAMQVVMDTLTPAERAAFVLHDVFGYPFDQITGVLGRSETAVRKLASRARSKVRGVPGNTRVEQAARAESREVVEAFLTAAQGGELATLLDLLASDVIMRADLVGRRMGAEAAYDGATAVAARFLGGAQGARPVDIDGDPGLAWIVGTEVKVAFGFEVAEGLVKEIELIADPEVLATIAVVMTGLES